MRYIKKKIEKKELINITNNNLYFYFNKTYFNVFYNKINIRIFHNNNINIIRKYLKESGIV